MWRNDLNNFSSGPHLVMVIEPETKTRFRYESEGASHGGLLGKQKGNRKKVYPTVKLEGYEGEKNVYIRVGLYTEDNEQHVFQFIGQSDESKPYVKEYVQEDNTATFKNLKFLSKKKEEICRILMDKKMEKLKDNNKCVRARFEERYSKELNQKARNMMNSVRLCFEAFEEDNEDISLCEPLYSDLICNQKAASKGGLKIHRISACAGSWKGGDDMILLCDKVQKEKIEIHFCETDSNQEIIWSSNAIFTPLDVHYQVAISFKTPQYRENSNKIVSIRLARNGEFSEPVEFKYVGDHNEIVSKKRKIYAEAVYESSPENVKFESLSSSSCNETSVCSISDEPQQTTNDEIMLLDRLNLTDLLNSDELSTNNFALSENFQNLNYSPELFHQDYHTPETSDYQLLGSELLCGVSQDEMNIGHAVDGLGVVAVKGEELSSNSVKSMNESKTRDHVQIDHQPVREKIMGQVLDFDVNIYDSLLNMLHADDEFKRVHFQDEIDGGHAVAQVGVVAVKHNEETPGNNLKFINKSKISNHSQIDHQKKLRKKLCGDLMKRNEFGNTYLHTAVCKHKSIEIITFILQLIKFAHADIINEKNYYQETALHLAVEQNNVELIETLLRHGSNPNLTNAEGSNCYHIATQYNYIDAMKSLLTVVKYSQQHDYKPKINAFNYEGLTPLHISVMKHSESCYNLLRLHLSDINICHPKSGKAVLHYAVEFHPPFVAILLKENEIKVNIQDFGGNTPLHIACATEKIEVVKQLLRAGANPLLKNYKQNCNTLEEECSEDDMDGQTPAEVTTNLEILEILTQASSEPNETVEKLCNLLDVDKKWKDIATYVIDEKYIDSLLCSPSPTRALLLHMKKEYKDCYIERLKNVLEITGPNEALDVIQEKHF